MTQNGQPEQQKDYISEAMEQLTPEEVNQCVNALLQSDPLIATRFDNIRYQVAIQKMGQKLEQYENSNSNGVVHDPEIVMEPVS